MSCHLILTYDISSDKLRTRVHRYLKNFGLNVQKSVFEILVESTDRERIIRHLLNIMDGAVAGDSIRIYHICRSCERAVSYSGVGIKITNLDWTVV